MPPLTLSNAAPLPAGVRLPGLDVLKGYAIVLVLIYHIGGIFGWKNWLHGEVGVDIFLVISGFTLTYGSAAISTREFLKRRLLRIFPAYWLALALFVILQAWVFRAPVSAGSIVTHALGVHAYSHPAHFSEINDSFWFISLILVLYLLYALIRAHLNDISYIVGIGALVTAVAAFLYQSFGHFGGVIQLAVRIPSFFVGIVAAQLMTRRETQIWPSGPLAVGLVALLAVGWNYGIIPYYGFAAVAMIALFLFAARRIQHLPEGRFCLRSLSFLGVYSYEIFLFHQPLIRDYNRVFTERILLGGATPTRTHMLLGIVVWLGITLLLAVVVHKATDRLFAALRKRPVPPTPSPTPVSFA